MVVYWVVGLFLAYVCFMKLCAWYRYNLPKLGTTVLVTGGCQGLGRQIALLYAKAGCRVVIWDIDQRLFKPIQDEFAAISASCIIDSVNVADKANVAEAVQRLRSQGVKVDILINNAGVAVLKRATELTEEEYRRVMDVNYYGMIWATLELLPEVSQVGFVASLCSYIPGYECAEYIASKHAVHAFIQCLRQELKAKNSKITLTALYPYQINTRLFKAYKPITLIDLVMKTLREEDVAKVMFDSLCSLREEVFVPAHARYIYSLFSILPTSFKDFIAILVYKGAFSNQGRVNYN